MLIYEFKLKGSNIQYTRMDEAIRIAQFIQNKALRYWMDNKGVNKYDLNMFTVLLHQEFEFVKKLNSSARQSSAERAWSAIAHFFQRCKQNVKEKGFPKFKKRTRSVEYKKSGWKLTNDLKHITFTDKNHIGTLKLIGKQSLHPHLKEIQRVRIVRRADGYYAQFVMSVDRKEHIAPTGSVVGLDLGLTHYYTDSNGNTLKPIKALRKAKKAIRRVHKNVSRTKKGSNNRKKAVKVLGRKYLKISRQRKDFAVKAARVLCQSHDLIALEDLSINNMIKNHKLARAIADAGWGIFKYYIKMYSSIYDKVVVFVNPRYTSQMCSACGAIVPKELSERWHNCTCGCELDRDHNAAINILKRGLETLNKDTAGHAGIWSSSEEDSRKPEESVTSVLTH